MPLIGAREPLCVGKNRDLMGFCMKLSAVDDRGSTPGHECLENTITSGQNYPYLSSHLHPGQLVTDCKAQQCCRSMI